MRHGAHFIPPPLLSPSPSPTVSASVTAGSQHPMLVSVFLALFLPCAGMSAVFIVYICLLWYATNYRTDNHSGSSSAVKPGAQKGLSVSELEKLPKVTGKELVLGTECAVCLDEIEAEQPARMVPGCNHGFHLQCADTWLSKHSVCPVCRAKLDPQQLLDASHDNDNPC
ncbi:Zinc finger, RING-type [Corchorus olitorius]|uniref:RING-type E3 ubiquitin transferase n=1 Tax=Corchorus olitorius TaxID=93759 RepID=A0A1R3HYX2_9ROSI|nr:Zinc finger, RING-type [Corchorus olitorius]